MKFKPPAAALGGGGNMPTILELTGAFIHCFGEERRRLFSKKFILATNGGGGGAGRRGKSETRQFYDRSTVCKEIFTTFDWLQATVLKVHAYAGCCGI